MKKKRSDRKMVINYEQEGRMKRESVRFIDYFFVCGLAEDRPIEICKQHEENDFSKFLDKKLVASILCHFPDNLAENPWQSDELWKLCAPGGLGTRVCGEEDEVEHNSNKKGKQRFHTFVLTREDGSKFHGHVLTFYEPCVDERVIRNICDVLGMAPPSDEQHMMVEKCFGFITPSAFINTCETILNFLYKRFVRNKNIGQNFPFESYIYNLLYEVPPLTYNCSCKVACISEHSGKNSLIIQKPARNELPPIDINLSEIFKLLGGASNLINLLTSILLERSILLVSEETGMQMHVTEGMTSLLFPFRWPHAVVSVLPVDLAVHFFDAPVPYIIGVLVPPNLKIQLRREIKVNQCYVDLDNAMVECPEDQPIFPGQEELASKLNGFYQRYQEEISEQFAEAAKRNKKKKKKRSSSGNGKLIDMQQRAGDEYLDNGDYGKDGDDDVDSLHAVSHLQQSNNSEEQPFTLTELRKFSEDRFNTSVRETIASCFVSFFFQYDKFIIQPAEEGSGSWQYQTDEIFDKTSFISDQPECRLPFLLPFLDSMMFAYMIDSWILSQQMHADTPVKDPYLRLFDDRIEQVKVLPEVRTPPLHLESSRFRTLSVSSNSMVHTTANHIEAWIRESEQGFKRRMSTVDYVSSPLHSLVPSSGSGGDNKSEDGEKTTRRHGDKDEAAAVVDGEKLVMKPKIDSSNVMRARERRSGSLPVIKANLLNSEGLKKRYLRRMNESRRTFKRQSSRSDSRWRKIAEMRNKLHSPPNLSEFSPEVIARTNWKFVEKLLNDVRVKTKRLLIGKMGQEAVAALGWSEAGIAGLEENTWIAGLCDLLERVWSHGLLTNQRKGKSALWSHLLRFHATCTATTHHHHCNSSPLLAASQQQQHKCNSDNLLAGSELWSASRARIAASTPSIVEEADSSAPQQQRVPVMAAAGVEAAENYYHSLPRSFLSSTMNGRSSKENRNSNPSLLTLTPRDQKQQRAEKALLESLDKIMAMRDVHTEVGRSRAWIRLALEQKKLHDYLCHLLSDSAMLNQMYKKYSLLQCEDERQQFLVHLLTLNTADFNSFTNSFPKTEIEYRVVVYPSRQLSLASGGTSANVYIRLHGELRHTNVIEVPRGSLDFTFKHQNLGFISSLIIGHDNYGVFPNWRLNVVTVENEMTGQVYAFPCFRSLGRTVDDGSIERLLIARQLTGSKPVSVQLDQLSEEAASRSSSSSVSIAELQERVGHAVNNLMTFFNRTQASHAALSPSNCCFTKLLVDGLVASLTDVFTHRLKKNKSRFMQRKPAYCWQLMAAVNDKLQSVIRRRDTNSSNGGGGISVAGDNDVANHFFAADFSFGGRSRSSNKQSAASGGFLSDSRNEQLKAEVNVAYRSEASILRERQSLVRLCQLYQRIQGQGQYRLGKDDMMGVLLCVAIHEHSISYWLPFVSRIAQNLPDLYEEGAFLCDENAVIFLAQLLQMLELCEIPLDESLLRGLHQTLLHNA